MFFTNACLSTAGHAWQGVCVAGREGHAWQRSMHGWGACVAGGVARGHLWQKGGRGHAWQDGWPLEQTVRILLETSIK